MIKPGDQINRYKVIKQLGRTMISETWQVDDNGTPKVLKVLLDNYYKLVELFQREAQVLKQLNHPGIPKVESDGDFTFQPEGATKPLYCLVMEFIEGQDLQTWLNEEFHKASQATEEAPTRKASQSATQSGQLIPENSQAHPSHQPISQEQAIDWLKQLVEILAQVHDCNYFHRDIKPSNIMRRPNGQLVLIDFGAVREVTLTYIEKLKGQKVTKVCTPEYAAPEQIDGKAVPQSDFFALGRTFVYLLTGRPPQNPQQYTNNWLVNWRNIAPQVSKSLADLIDDLMAPSPEKRPKNAQEILQSLAIISVEPSIRSSLSALPRSLRFFVDIFAKYQLQQFVKQIRTPKIALYGRTKAGKSSLINAIMGKIVAPVGTSIEPETQANKTYTYSRNGWPLHFVDSRGVGDLPDNTAFEEGIKYIVDRKIDVLLFVVNIIETAFSHQDIEFLEQLKKAHHKKHQGELQIILVINHIDRVNPPGWDPPYNLNFDSHASSRQPKNRKETKIREFIMQRRNQYKKLTYIYVPVCAYWDLDGETLYNIDQLKKQIYKLIPDEATKLGFGGASAGIVLKKVLASKFTLAGADFADWASRIPAVGRRIVFETQLRLVSMIALLVDTQEDQSSKAKEFLEQVVDRKADAQSDAAMTLAIGEAAISYFIEKDGKDIAKAQQAFEEEIDRREPEFQRAESREKRVGILRQLDAELSERYGVPRLYDGDGQDDSNG